MPYSAEDVRARDWILRLLLVGPPKAGKTLTAVLTSPGPVFVFNTDGMGALDPVVQRGGELIAEDINSLREFDKTYGFVVQHADEIKTVVFDNISGFAGIIEDEVRKESKNEDGRAIYGEYGRRMMYVFKKLTQLPINLIIIGHVEEGEPTVGSFGKVLAVPGKPKIAIPMKIQDWVWLDTRIDPQSGQVISRILLAPQGSWTSGARSIRGVPYVDVNIDHPDPEKRGGISKFLELVATQRATMAKPTAVKQTPQRSTQPVKR